MESIDLIEATRCYDLGARVHTGSMSEAAAITKLVGDLGMNRSSAGDYVRVFRHMLRGEVYKRTLNAASTGFYLDAIARDFGAEGHRSALRSLQLHIDYYVGIRQRNMPALRVVADGEKSRDFKVDDFGSKVTMMMGLPHQDRRKLLPATGHKPAIKVVTSKAFVRSFAVVAQV